MKYHFAVDLPQGVVIPTTNRLFRPSRRGGHLHLYKDPKARAFQTYLIASFSQQTALQKILRIHGDCPLLLDIALQFTFVKRFFLRDTSNAIKVTEDALAQVLGIDDSQFTSIAGRKLYRPTVRRERIAVSVTLFARDHLCQCGCYTPAHIVGRTDRTRGLVAYTPYLYNPGHHPNGQEADDDCRNAAGA